MNKKRFYEEEKIFTVYALHISEEEEYVFVGKTRSPRISAIYSEHICGKRASTAAYFDKEDRPNLYVLETLWTTEDEAYKHVVAWVKVFQDNGYVCINHEGTLRHAEGILPETLEMVRNITRAPLKSILKERYVEHPKDADRKEDDNQQGPDCEEIIQMNLRLNQSVKQKFDTFRKRTGTNQREAFLLLLDHAEGDSDYLNLKKILNERDKKILMLKKENDVLKKELSIEKKKPTADELLEEQYRFMQFGIRTYLDCVYSNLKNEQPLKSLNYKKFMKQIASDQYEYPKQEGFMLLILEAVLWGTSIHRARFLVGEGVDGKRYKLRYYPKQKYVGVDIHDLSKGKYWLGFRKAKDGAMELMAAFPMYPVFAAEREEKVSDNIGDKKISLEEMIKKAKDKG